MSATRRFSFCGSFRAMTKRPLTDLENANFRIGVLSETIDKLTNTLHDDPNRAAQYGWDGIEEKARELVKTPGCFVLVGQHPEIWRKPFPPDPNVKGEKYCGECNRKLDDDETCHCSCDCLKGADWLSGKADESKEATMLFGGIPYTAVWTPRTEEGLRTEREGLLKEMENLHARAVRLEAEKEGLKASLEVEEEAAQVSGGILSNVCDILFEDPERAATHGYEGVQNKAKDYVERVGQTRDFELQKKILLKILDIVESMDIGELPTIVQQLQNEHDRREAAREGMQKIVDQETAARAVELDAITADLKASRQNRDLASNHSIHSPEDREAESDRGDAIFSVRGHKIKIDEEGIIWLSGDMISWKYLCRITDE